ncbi:MAG: aspartate-semialdehyde dehydrogenase [Verrucomicrobiota bacterium]|nr:aspartate-semialdehyde dehydrogenase [Verrucomicrobiota bacterium]
MKANPHIAIVGATGAVGIELLETMERRAFPVGHLTLLASARSAGKKLTFSGKEYSVKELTPDSFQGVDIAIFSAGASISREFAPHAVKAGAVVIDNSSAFRMDDSVPLVIPEINAHAISSHKGIIANPNCTTAITLMALYPLHKQFGLKRMIASTYQAASGAGAQAMEELQHQIKQLEKGELVTVKALPYQIAFNVIPQVDVFLDSGYTKEEMKLANESRKILDHPALKASATCVRVPVLRAHAISLTAEFEKAITPDLARAVLKDAPGIDLMDDPSTKSYPMPIQYSGQFNCAVGRIRQDCALDNALSLWVVGDQLLKGAALNAIQIAEELA